MHQWVKELNKWFPLCRVAVLHTSGAYTGSKQRLILRIGINSKYAFIIFILLIKSLI